MGGRAGGAGRCCISALLKQLLNVRKLLLDSQLSFFEQLDSPQVRHWAVLFVGQLAFKTGMFELQCTGMRLFHKGFSLG